MSVAFLILLFAFAVQLLAWVLTFLAYRHARDRVDYWQGLAEYWQRAYQGASR